ncbi:MAG: YceI family protein [Actinomycetota bacterium]|nr:YceI family protein [Actinomycetota bacterium]
MYEVQTTGDRTVERGADGLATGTYHLDVAHSYIGFAVRHLAVATVRGRFADFDGVVVVGDDRADVPLRSVRVEIEAGSVDTCNTRRDDHLRSADFFDVATHPTWTFASTAVRPAVAGAFDIDGELTIRGTTCPVTLSAELGGVVIDPYGELRIGFSAAGEIDRQDFGVSFGAVLDGGGLVVANQVRIEVEAEAVFRR